MSNVDINVDRRTDGRTDGRTENRTPISHPATSRCDKNGQKGMISMRMLILSNTIQKVKTKFVINFKILGTVVPEISLTEKKSLHTDTHRDKHCYRKDKNYIPPILCMVEV